MLAAALPLRVKLTSPSAEPVAPAVAVASLKYSVRRRGEPSYASWISDIIGAGPQAQVSVLRKFGTRRASDSRRWPAWSRTTATPTPGPAVRRR